MNECTHTFTGAGSSLLLRGPTPPPIQDTGHFTLDSLVQDILEDKPEVLKEFCQSMDKENLFGNGWKGFVKIQMWNHIHHFHISHNAPYSPAPKKENLHNLCLSFLLCITAMPWEIENNAYAKFFLGGGANKVHYGKCGSGILSCCFR